MKAFLAVPDVPDQYPVRAIRSGLRALGIDISKDPGASDLLVTWTPWRRSWRAKIVDQFVFANQPWLVVENGWLSPIREERFYQIALRGWGGAGIWDGQPDDLKPLFSRRHRWEAWGLEIEPWTQRAAETGIRVPLIIGQRGHPWDERTAVPGWHESLDLGPETAQAIRRSRDCTTPLLEHLRKATECHVWTSNAASWALLHGVPVVQHGPQLLVSELCSRPGELLRCPARLEAFQRLATAQWTEEEIATGVPLKRVLALV